MKQILIFLSGLVLFVLNSCELVRNEEEPFVEYRRVISWTWLSMPGGNICTRVTYDDGVEQTLCGASVEFQVQGEEVCIILKHDGVTEEITCGRFEIEASQQQTCVYFRAGNDRDLVFCRPVSERVVVIRDTLIRRDTVILPGRIDTLIIDRPVAVQCYPTIWFDHFIYRETTDELHASVRLKRGTCSTCLDDATFMTRPVEPAKFTIDWTLGGNGDWRKSSTTTATGDICENWSDIDVHLRGLEKNECAVFALHDKNGQKLFSLLWTAVNW